MNVYGLISDLHAHRWDAFSTIGDTGRNSRLMDIINEINRCSQAVIDHGGKLVVIAGDVFHTRGTVDPHVFNPVRDALTKWVQNGLSFRVIAGNHDLAGRDAAELGSSVQMLRSESIRCYHQPHIIHGNGSGPNQVFVPWHSSATGYIEAIESITEHLVTKGEGPKGYDLILHLGIDGTLKHMPDHNVSASKLAAFGYRRVFSGHYHHAMQFPGTRVFSIGAATHQTFSDVGTKAGWWIIDNTSEKFFASHAPSFVDLTGDEEPGDIPLIVDGHFVRAKLGPSTIKEVNLFRKMLTDAGAKGAVIESSPKTAASRGGTSKSISSLGKSVMDYIAEKKHAPEVAAFCKEVLTGVGVSA